MTGLRISETLTLPEDAVTETFAILAKRRAGKSNAAVVMAEEMYDHSLPWVAIDPKGDWWGVRAAGDGKAPGLSVLVFGGNHGDVPLEPTSGRLVADLIVGQRLTSVLDVSEMTKADQRRFLIDFADRLYRTNTEPLHVFCEEADEYIPQRVMGENAKLVGVFETLVKRGGFRGIGITLITQRSASLNKDVLTQIETLIPMRTPSPQDRKAILSWVDYHSSGAEAVAELPGLADGEAWVFSPQWLRTLVKIKFRRRRTFDSGATPKVGGKPRPPATLAEVDLGAIKEAMAETIEKAAADDPKALRRRIAELERQLATTPEPKVEVVKVPVLGVNQLDAFTSMSESLLQVLSDVQDRLQQYPNELPTEGKQGRSPTTGGVAHRTTPRSASSTIGGTPKAGSSTMEKDPPAARETRPAAAGGPPAGDVQVKAGARRILETLARYQPMRLTKAQLGTLAKFKITGGTFQTYWSTLRRAGLIDDNGVDVTITQAGLDHLGLEQPPEPLTTDELIAQWRDVLKAGARAMLDVLVDAYPRGISKDDLAAQVEMTASGGTFQTYLSTLRRNGLIDVDGPTVTASETLFLGT